MVEGSPDHSADDRPGRPCPELPGVCSRQPAGGPAALVGGWPLAAGDRVGSLGPELAELGGGFGAGGRSAEPAGVGDDLLVRLAIGELDLGPAGGPAPAGS